MDGVADRIGPGGAVDEEVGDPALGNAEAEAAAIFEPALVSDCRHHGAVAGHGGDDAGAGREGLHESAVDVALDAVAEQMRPFSAAFDKPGSVRASSNPGLQRIY